MKKYTFALIGGVFALTASAQIVRADDDPTFQMKNKVDEEIRYRPDTGLSKMRTMGQSDVDKDYFPKTGMFSKIRLHSTLRGSYDAAYELNSQYYGNTAGGQVTFQQNGIGPFSAGAVAWGQGLKGTNVPSTGGLNAFASAPVVQALFPANNLGFNLANNPNQGLQIVDYWQGADKGIGLATPVRPCNIDKRGCIKGYMDFSGQELAAPEFNDRLDFLREAFVDADIPIGQNTLAIRLGRQQLVWGRTDLFHVLDVVNPVDYSRNNIYDENSDIRIPMGMLRADYRMGAVGPFGDLNFQGDYVFEPYRPNNLGQAGSPNNPLGAAQFFRSMKNCWDNGCTVNNFAFGGVATDFGVHQIGIRQANLPSYSPYNSTFGGKVEGEIEGLGFSLNALHYRSPMPALHGAKSSVNSFGVAPNMAYPYMIAFDIDFPMVTLIGGSLDFAIEPIETAFRIETTYTKGEEFADTAQPQLYKKSDVIRYVVGADRATFIRFLNPNRAFLFSGQVFGQHINNYELTKLTTGTVGMPDFRDNWVATLLIKGWYEGDTISPQLIMARDFLAKANVMEPSIEWTPSARWRFRLGSNVKFGQYKQAFDDNHGNNPYLFGPNAFPGVGGFAGAGASWGMEPLGRFKNGILGMANNETEIFANVTVRF